MDDFFMDGWLISRLKEKKKPSPCPWSNSEEHITATDIKILFSMQVTNEKIHIYKGSQTRGQPLREKGE